jgi:5-formyltetrahydrofolate cyclo-ligase
MPPSKEILRREARALRLAAPAFPAWSAALVARLRADRGWRDARRVGAFLPLPDEPDLRPLLAERLAAGGFLAFPAVAENGLWHWRELTSLHAAVRAPGGLGVRQPPPSPPVDPLGLDLILVPCRALDGRGHRLGRGQGIYDRLLAGLPGRTLAVLFHRQLVPEVPAEPHDVPLRAAVTERWGPVDLPFPIDSTPPPADTPASPPDAFGA